MTVEEKAKRYDEAIGKLRGMMPNWERLSYNGKTFLQDIIHIFPELKESEDERIRNEIISAIKEDWPGHTDWIDYLEKQGEPNTVVVIPKFRVGDVIRPKGSMAEYTIESISGECYHGKGWGLHISCDDDYELVKQKSADKVGHKFEIGDLITNGILVGKIDEIHELGYHAYFGDHYADVPDAENWHKWSAADAKDGDVLYSRSSSIEYIVMSKGINRHGNIDSYFRYNSLNGFGIDIPAVLSTKYDNITPATKEQRDLLFKKMHEAGYEWDAEKKELKKIEQKSSWSEEDETMLKRIIDFIPQCMTAHGYNEYINWLKSLKERVQPQPKQEWSKEDENNILFLTSIIEECFKDKEKITLCGDTVCANFTKKDVIDRLKSLRPKSQWKPSDEQMDALYTYIYNPQYFNSPDPRMELVESVYKDLKKLKE